MNDVKPGQVRDTSRRDLVQLLGDDGWHLADHIRGANESVVSGR